MRSFVALDLDPALKESVAEYQRILRKLGSPTVSWTRETGMHLTLKFLGEIDATQADRLKESLAGICSGIEAFPLTIKGTGTFPPHRTPRILWVGAEAPTGLADLQAGVAAAAEEIGVPADDRPFHAHLTLGRVRAPGGLLEVLAALERDRMMDFGAMIVRNVTLFESLLMPTGAEYRPLALIPLK